MCLGVAGLAEVDSGVGDGALYKAASDFVQFLAMSVVEEVHVLVEVFALVGGCL